MTVTRKNPWANVQLCDHKSELAYCLFMAGPCMLNLDQISFSALFLLYFSSCLTELEEYSKTSGDSGITAAGVQSITRAWQAKHWTFEQNIVTQFWHIIRKKSQTSMVPQSHHMVLQYETPLPQEMKYYKWNYTINYFFRKEETKKLNFTHVFHR